MTADPDVPSIARRVAERLPFFYGWVIVFLGFLGVFMMGATTFWAIPVFIGPMEDDTGWSRGAIFGALTVRFIVGAFFGMLLGRFIKSVGLKSNDRTLGGTFGLVRGVVIGLAFALLAGLTRFPSHPAWKDSFFGPPLGRTVEQLKPWLPPALAGRLRYH